jgi:sugar fermentation stimulation protein A
MQFHQPTFIGTIQNRYKRFLSDITLDNGEQINAHVPNTGSMQTCWEPGWKVLTTFHDDPKRKMKYTLELTHNGKSWIAVNTSLTNKLVHEALLNNQIVQLQDYTQIKPEQSVLDSRLDFFLSGHATSPCAYVEVKNVTLKSEQAVALFPDAVSTRGQKHLKDLMKIKAMGHRAIMLYVINREDVTSFSSAKTIDPVYAQLLSEAKDAGVEILAYQTTITEKEISISKEIEVKL